MTRGPGALPGADGGAGLLLLLLSAKAPSVLGLEAEARVLPHGASLRDGVQRGELESEAASCPSISPVFRIPQVPRAASSTPRPQAAPL